MPLKTSRPAPAFVSAPLDNVPANSVHFVTGLLTAIVVWVTTVPFLGLFGIALGYGAGATLTALSARHPQLVAAVEAAAEDFGLVILKSVMENGEELLSTLDSDEELDKVYDLFMEQLMADEDEEN